MNGQRVGYIRVSTLDEQSGRQLEGLELDRTFVDHASGKDTKRPQLEELLSFVRSVVRSSSTAWTGLRGTWMTSGALSRR